MTRREVWNEACVLYMYIARRDSLVGASCLWTERVFLCLESAVSSESM